MAGSDARGDGRSFTILYSFGVFMALAAAAILVADFWTVWNIPDLYRPGGIYWFSTGVNWRAFVACFCGMSWALPGFVFAMGGPFVSSGWTHLYQVSFFFGHIVSEGLDVVLNWLCPPLGLGKQVDFELVDGTVVGQPLEVATDQRQENIEKGGK